MNKKVKTLKTLKVRLNVYGELCLIHFRDLLPIICPAYTKRLFPSARKDKTYKLKIYPKYVNHSIHVQIQKDLNSFELKLFNNKILEAVLYGFLDRMVDLMGQLMIGIEKKEFWVKLERPK